MFYYARVMDRCHRVGDVVTRQDRVARITLDDASRSILAYLDGEHSQEDLLRELLAAVDRGEVSILIDGIPATGGQAVVGALNETLRQSLMKLAANGLLVD